MSDAATSAEVDVGSVDEGAGDVDFGETLVRLDGLTKHFTSESGYLAGLTLARDGNGVPRPTYERDWVRAVDDVSFEIEKGETLGLVGESGCGKSTLARTILRLVDPTDGAVYFKGENLAELSGEALRTHRKDMQMIFQDPQSSLNPRMKVGPIVEEPMRAHGMFEAEAERSDESAAELREERARELLGKVGLDPQHYNRYPHQFSGGQRQRVNLARALSVNPDFIVCDEPTSALDASIQAQVLNTMMELQDEFGLTYLFISHDLSVIRHISDRVAVMYLGHVVELADKEELFENPQHPYTESLLSAIPVPDPRRAGERHIVEGDVPSPINPPSGCRFHTRCPSLIAPKGYDFTSSEWDAVRAFVRAVDRRNFEADGAQAVRRQFFADADPRGEAGDVVDRAISLVADDEWEEADALLTESFVDPSICARERPSYEVPPEFGTGPHFAACHLHRDEEQTY